ncbi:MAG: hypothetical protein RIR48_284 [Bacteroidota bacterium]
MIISLFRTGRYLVTGLAAIVVLYSIFYLSKSYQEILFWYGGEMEDFFRKDEWSSRMFSEDVKKVGNILCIALSVLLLLSLVYLWKIKSSIAPVKIVWNYSFQDIFIVIIAFFFWGYYQALTPYAYDEIFSAFHFASHSAWLSLSYYPLPNNHILYNVLNAFVGQLSGGHFLVSGRIISLMAYVVTALLTYRVSKHVLKVEWRALLSSVLVLSQFPVVGFATQARGYSMLVMCTMLAIYALWNKKGSSYYFWDVGIVAGMAVMPSFLYFWVGLGLSGLFLLNGDKISLYSFLKHNFISALVVLSFYLPVLSVSGYQSIVANKYVTSTSTGLSDFFQSFLESHYVRGLFNEWFNTGSNVMIGVVLISIWIVAAFLIKDQNIRRWNILTAGTIVGAILIIMFTQKLPFYRNLAPISAALWIAISLTFGAAILKISHVKRNIFYAFSTCILIFFAHYRLHHILPDQLYYYDVKNTYERHQLCLTKNKVNQGAVTLHEDAFYWYGLLPKQILNHHTNQKIAPGLYIALVDTKVPNHYTLLWECEGYKCYKIPD